MSLSYEMEVLIEIWDSNGGHIEVGPDRDGLGLLEIRTYNASVVGQPKVPAETMLLETEQAGLLALALMEQVQRQRSVENQRQQVIQQQQNKKNQQNSEVSPVTPAVPS